jgi:RNA polymerase sigma-70 factor (ECF subfamily)
MKLKLSGDKTKTELSQVSDTNLMRRFQAGDEECFKELVHRHAKIIFGYVYRVLRGCVEAEYITRDIFVQAYKQRDNYKSSVKFGKWMLVLCRQHCLALHERSKRPFGHMTRLPEGARVSFRKLPAPGYISRSNAVNHDQLSLFVKREVDALPMKQRELFVLSRYHKLSYSEIADITGVPADTVRQTLNKVKLSLVERMRGVLE